MPQVTTIPRQGKDRVLGAGWLGTQGWETLSEAGRVGQKVDPKQEKLRKVHVLNDLKAGDGAEEGLEPLAAGIGHVITALIAYWRTRGPFPRVQRRKSLSPTPASRSPRLGSPGAAERPGPGWAPYRNWTLGPIFPGSTSRSSAPQARLGLNPLGARLPAPAGPYRAPPRAEPLRRSLRGLLGVPRSPGGVLGLVDHLLLHDVLRALGDASRGECE